MVANFPHSSTRCITRHHAHHYLGFAETQWKLFAKESPPRVKPLLYVFRVLLTGLHLMRTGTIEANLEILNADAALPYLDELIARKRAGSEGEVLGPDEVIRYESEKNRLLSELEQARDRSSLPDRPTVRPQLHELLLRLRGG